MFYPPIFALGLYTFLLSDREGRLKGGDKSIELLFASDQATITTIALIPHRFPTITMEEKGKVKLWAKKRIPIQGRQGAELPAFVLFKVDFYIYRISIEIIMKIIDLEFECAKTPFKTK